ncbi:alpha/beta fold hydrolase [Candidatus Pacearchaeota archaeon]|nr:alpha/beta fold hydrolase [Candidatus Pacearchaeota archaeon]
MKNQVYEEQRRIGRENGVELEVISYFQDKEAPKIVFATGFGGCAEKYPLIDSLTRDFNVASMSPRNFGRSTGRYTIDNYANDLKFVVDDVSQIDGKKPYAMGHSLGGYTFAKLAGEDKPVEKLVLLDPLINPTEQFPSLVNWYFSDCVKKNKVPLKPVIRLGNVPGFGLLKKLRTFGKSVFSEDDVKTFIDSLYNAQSCSKELLVPTYAVLSGSTYLMIPTSKSWRDNLRAKWENFGAEVDVYPRLNHWFSGGLLTGVGDVFCKMEKEGITDKIKEFFRE